MAALRLFGTHLIRHHRAGSQPSAIAVASIARRNRQALTG